MGQTPRSQGKNDGNHEKEYSCERAKDREYMHIQKSIALSWTKSPIVKIDI